ncbi:hypothetical protein J6590_108267 [Homalodisca vitripennis]|nr:hypothetical protein J6590_108267 [Homalodisca vitripennis]
MATLNPSQEQKNRVVERDSSMDLEKKRALSSESEEETNKQRKTADKKINIQNLPTPLFLVFKHKDESQNLAKVSPFLVNKALVGVGGSPSSVRKLRNGSILVEAANAPQAQKFLSMRSFYDKVEVVVHPHETLNFCKGIVFCRDMLCCSIEELKEELKDCLVTDVVRIMKVEHGVPTPTPGHILTFALPHPPATIRAGYLSLQVRPYFRNPQRCYRCQRFGHSSKTCNNPETCSLCGKSGHSDKDCAGGEEQCVNCKGKHPSSSRSCKVYLEEKEVLKIVTSEKLSFSDARKEYRKRLGQTPKKDVSYSQAASVPVQPKPCASCSALEGMVRELTQQVAALVQQISAKTFPRSVGTDISDLAPSVPVRPTTPTQIKGRNTSKQQSTEGQIAAQFLKTPNAGSVTGKKNLSPEVRQKLVSGLNPKIASKVVERSKGANRTPPSHRSSKSSLMEEDLFDDDLRPHSELEKTTVNFKQNQGKTRNKITFKT